MQIRARTLWTSAKNRPSLSIISGPILLLET